MHILGLQHGGVDAAEVPTVSRHPVTRRHRDLSPHDVRGASYRREYGALLWGTQDKEAGGTSCKFPLWGSRNDGQKTYGKGLGRSKTGKSMTTASRCGARPHRTDGHHGCSTPRTLAREWLRPPAGHILLGTSTESTWVVRCREGLGHEGVVKHLRCVLALSAIMGTRCRRERAGKSRPNEPLTRAVKEQIFGLDAAQIFGVDVHATRNELPKDYLSRIKMAYLDKGGTPGHRWYGWVTR